MVSPTQILQAVAFLDLLAAGLIMPQLPPHARQLGCNHLLIGTMGALYAGLQLVSGPIIGSWSDLKGKKAVLILTISLSGIAYVLLGLTSSIVVLLGLRAFLGCFKYTQLLTKTIAPDYEKDTDQLIFLYGRLEVVSSLGLVLGPIISGNIMETYPENGFTGIAIMVGAIFAMNSGLIRQLPKHEIKKKDKTKDKAIAPTLIGSLISSFKQSTEHFYKLDWSSHWEVFILRVLMILCTSVYFCNFAIYLKIKHQASPQTLGYITSLVNLISLFFTYFVGYVNKLYEDDKDFKMRTYHVFLTLTLSLLGMALAPNVAVYVALMIPLVVSAVVGRSVTLEIILNNADKSQRGTIIGVANNFRNVTAVLAPLIAGTVGEYVGVLYIIFVALSLAAIGTYRSHKLIPEFIIKGDLKSKSE